MLRHTDPHLSHALNLMGGADRPILITGRRGTGRMTYIRHYIRHVSCPRAYHPFADAPALDCACDICRRVEGGRTDDIVTLAGDAPIADMRAGLRAVAGEPIHLPHRWLVLPDLERHSRDAAHTLLKLIEEPPACLRVMATASGPLPPALQSRFMVFAHPALTAPEMRDIAGDMLDYPGFTSVTDLATARRIDFEGRYQRLFVQARADTLESQSRDMVRDIRDAGLVVPSTLAIFVEWLLGRLARGPVSRGFTRLLPSMLSRWLQTCHLVVRDPGDRPLTRESGVDIESQWVTLMLSLFLLRVST